MKQVVCILPSHCVDTLGLFVLPNSLGLGVISMKLLDIPVKTDNATLNGKQLTEARGVQLSLKHREEIDAYFVLLISYSYFMEVAN